MINSSSLFHFTKEFGAFKQILAEGLRFSYCYEPFGSVVAKQGLDIEIKKGSKILECKGIAIPMICFCDIPLLRTQQHRRKYGQYMIGFEKEALINLVNETEYFINPVQYRCCPLFDEQLEILSFQKLEYINKISIKGLPVSEIEIQQGEKRKDLLFSHLIMKPEIKEECEEEIKNINAIDSVIGFSKPYKGECGYDYTAEREWRIIIPDCNRPAPNLGWIKYATKDLFEDFRLSLYDNYPQEIYLQLNKDSIVSLITHIAVSNEIERKYIGHYILKRGKKVFGCNLTEKQRLNLISKTTSFEQIEKDY